MSEDLPLQGRRVVVPETRELDLLARLLEERGAVALRCPLVAILDCPDPAPVESWLRRFVALPPQLLVLMTGEGLRRLHKAAVRAEMGDAFRAALNTPRCATRGPKPARALRDLGLDSALRAAVPTMEGMIELLAPVDLAGKRVGLQLYPDAPDKLTRALAAQGAQVDAVVPYIYAGEVDEARVAAMIETILAGEAEAIAFTSSPQVRRLFEVATRDGKEAALTQALARLTVAAVGPVVGEALTARGVTVDVMPAEAFFMKPLVNGLEQAAAA
jgi:uroporphyrinogen-III synthase